MKEQHIVSSWLGSCFRVPPLLFFILAVIALFLSSCAQVEVSQDYDTGYLFDKKNTYGWNTTIPAGNGDLLLSDELLAKRFKSAIDTTLANRGFIQAPQPHFLVSCTYTIKSRLESENFDSGFGFGFGRFGRYGGVGMSTGSTIRQYDQGTLVINIHSAATKKLIWKGTGSREVFIHSTPDEITRSVNEMVEAVLAQFPPVQQTTPTSYNP